MHLFYRREGFEYVGSKYEESASELSIFESIFVDRQDYRHISQTLVVYVVTNEVLQYFTPCHLRRTIDR